VDIKRLTNKYSFVTVLHALLIAILQIISSLLKEEFVSELSNVWNGKHRGTHPRTQKFSSFPFTFGHPNDLRNIADEGISMTRWSVRGAPSEKGSSSITIITYTTRCLQNNFHSNKKLTLQGYMAGAVHRDFKGSVVMLSTNHTHLIIPKHRTWRQSVQTPIELTILNPDIDSGEDSDYLGQVSQESDGENMCFSSSDDSNSSSINSRVRVTRSGLTPVLISFLLHHIDFKIYLRLFFICVYLRRQYGPPCPVLTSCRCVSANDLYICCSGMAENSEAGDL
jgi:hypothetical protein